MAITTSLYKGKEELTMAQYEALEAIDENIDYNIIDHPNVGITNAQMAFALTCVRLFQAGETYTCIDNGTYSEGHNYRLVVENNIKSWRDISPAGVVEDNLTINKNSLGQIQTIGLTDTNNIYTTAQIIEALTIERS